MQKGEILSSIKGIESEKKPKLNDWKQQRKIVKFRRRRYRKSPFRIIQRVENRMVIRRVMNTIPPISMILKMVNKMGN